MIQLQTLWRHLLTKQTGLFNLASHQIPIERLEVKLNYNLNREKVTGSSSHHPPFLLIIFLTIDVGTVCFGELSTQQFFMFVLDCASSLMTGTLCHSFRKMF